MIIGVGVDVCSIERFEGMLQRRPGIAARILTAHELTLPVTSQAGRFAAKEALAKALGSPGGMRWLDCEVVKTDDGVPSFVASGTVRARIEELGIERIHLSISHDGDYATTMVVCEK